MTSLRLFVLMLLVTSVMLALAATPLAGQALAAWATDAGAQGGVPPTARTGATPTWRATAAWAGTTWASPAPRTAWRCTARCLPTATANAVPVSCRSPATAGRAGSRSAASGGLLPRPGVGQELAGVGQQLRQHPGAA